MDKLIKRIVSQNNKIYEQLRLASWVFFGVFGLLAAINHSFSTAALAITLFLSCQVAAALVDSLEYTDHKSR